MNKGLVALAGIGAGAGMMYLADSREGRRRRARLRELTVHSQLLKGVRAVAGVTTIENRLEPHREAGHVSALQGPGPREVPRMPARWNRWSPTARLIAGVAGLALVALSSPKRPVRGAATGIAGVELLERALWGTHARA
jgi:hypothetical protein